MDSVIKRATKLWWDMPDVPGFINKGVRIIGSDNKVLANVLSLTKKFSDGKYILQKWVENIHEEDEGIEVQLKDEDEMLELVNHNMFFKDVSEVCIFLEDIYGTGYDVVWLTLGCRPPVAASTLENPPSTMVITPIEHYINLDSDEEEGSDNYDSYEMYPYRKWYESLRE